MKNMVLGLFIAVLVLVVALLVHSPDVETVVSFCVRAGCLTVFFWALLEIWRRNA